MSTLLSKLPNHTIQKKARKQSDVARKLNVLLTADEVRKMPYNDPIRQAHQLGGDRGVRAYFATLQSA